MTKRARRRRSGTDGGVNQSAFVALLVAVILVITTSLIVFGPKVGGVVADYFICQLLGGDAGDCRTGQDLPPAIAPNGPSDGNDPGTATVVDLGDFADDFGVDPEDLSDAMVQGQNLLIPLGMDVCEVAGIYAEGYPLPGLPPDPDAQNPSCDASVTVKDGQITVDVPDDEVHAELWKWVIQLISGAIAITSGLLAFGACTAALSATAAVCPYIAGFFIGFMYSLASQLISGEKATDWDTWAAALVTGLASAIPAAYSKAWPVISSFTKTAVKAIGRGLLNGAVKIGGWATSFVRGVGSKLDDLYQALRNAFDVVPAPI